MNLTELKYRTYSGEEATNVVDDANEQLIVLAFSAAWTGQGQIIDNFYEELANIYSDVLFLRIDVEKSEDYAQKYGIKHVPTTLFMKKGDIVGHFEGLLPKAEIKVRIEDILLKKD